MNIEKLLIGLIGTSHPSFDQKMDLCILISWILWFISIILARIDFEKLNRFLRIKYPDVLKILEISGLGVGGVSIKALKEFMKSDRYQALDDAELKKLIRYQFTNYKLNLLLGGIMLALILFMYIKTGR